MRLAQITWMTRSSRPTHSTVRNAYVGSVAAGAFAFLNNLAIDDNGLAGVVVVGASTGSGWGQWYLHPDPHG